ncbi:chemotaxis protein CheX [Brassicibacter mesophilus]|uniref:chemotaxis protein CheX n=1 Tax=Brassicibacter mesophilus TaxID=745119 RepID=UPI003D1A6E77
MSEMKPYVTNNLILGSCINVVIGVTGILSGQIIVGFTQNLAMYFSSKMLGNMVVTLDEQVKKSVFELCKLIIGNSCISLFDSGVSVNIVSMCIINGENIEYSSIDQEIICIPFEAQHGKMLVYLQLSNSKDKYVDD